MPSASCEQPTLPAPGIPSGRIVTSVGRVDVAGGIVDRAQRLADDVLFPAALDTDTADLVPVELLDELAARGFYGLFCPPQCGGLGCDAATGFAVIEALASGCLTTTFVWVQHLGGAVAACLSTGAIREEWAEDLCRGRRRAGVAFAHLRRPGPPLLTAVPVDAGWRLDGTAPWVTGWGRIDVVHTAAREGDDIVWVLVDAESSSSLTVTRLPLAAIDASATVEMHLHGHVVSDRRVTHREPLAQWLERDAGGLRANGSLALGLVRRCCHLLGASPVDDRLAEVRHALDSAGPEELPAARAAATALALQASAALVAKGGGRAIVRDQHAQRLAREALFLLVQGQTAGIRHEQVRLLGASM
jgi:alkylation response protein AidB-like acyl-CoA dehydrogenase